MPQTTEDQENDPDNHEDDADGPEDADVGKGADEKEYESEDDHVVVIPGLVTGQTPPAGAGLQTSPTATFHDVGVNVSLRPWCRTAVRSLRMLCTQLQ